MKFILYESHPQDGRIREIQGGGASPSCTVKWAKGTADTPIVLMFNDYDEEQYSTIKDN